MKKILTPLFLVLFGCRLSAQMHTMPLTVKKKVEKGVSLHLKTSAIKSKGQKIEFKTYAADSSSYILFKGVVINDSTTKGDIKNFTFDKTTRLSTERETYSNKSIINYTPCTNHHPRHIKDTNPTPACIWGDPVVFTQ